MGGFMMLAFWGAVIALIVFLVLRLRDNGTRPPDSDAQEALRRRFANGEIDEEEFSLYFVDIKSNTLNIAKSES